MIMLCKGENEGKDKDRWKQRVTVRRIEGERQTYENRKIVISGFRSKEMFLM